MFSSAPVKALGWCGCIRKRYHSAFMSELLWPLTRPLTPVSLASSALAQVTTDEYGRRASR